MRRLPKLPRLPTDLRSQQQKAFVERNTPGVTAQPPPNNAPASVAPGVEPYFPPSEGRTEVYTYFTNQVGANALLYSAISWVRVKLILQTVGPVSVSTREDVVPTLSGKGAILTQNVPLEFDIPSGSRLYITADAINRVTFVVQPLPWLNELYRQVGSLPGTLASALGSVVSSVSAAIPGRSGGGKVNCP